MIGIQLIQASRWLLWRAHAELDPRLGLSVSDALLLLSVHANPGTTANDLAVRICRDKTTLSRSIARLVEAGLLRSALDSVDGRRKNLYLTREGDLAILSALDSLDVDLELAADRLDDHTLSSLAILSENLVQLAGG